MPINSIDLVGNARIASVADEQVIAVLDVARNQLEAIPRNPATTQQVTAVTLTLE